MMHDEATRWLAGVAGSCNQSWNPNRCIGPRWARRVVAERCQPPEWMTDGMRVRGRQEVLVLETKAANEATADILQAHSIPAAVSKDLADLLAAPPHQPDGILEAS